ncbi:protein XRP2-like [Tubulanus polymorphus]|uniref:protein XRP2-like n=1 Tax=Tubulanus polymorphus TaxID=672921 RepID=UPI003DA50A5B
MGCLFSKSSRRQAKKEKLEEEKAEEQDEVPEEEPIKLDPKDFIIENKKGETFGRTPGKVRGQQFMINNCEDCNIYIFDHIATVTIDDCTNCTIFLGPVQQSVYIRDCTDIRLMAACQQYRTRDCRKVDTYLCCTTQPVIESSTSMKFGCFQCFYPELEPQFHKAGLSVYNNNWSTIHDFTPVPGENNFSIMDNDEEASQLFSLPTADYFHSLQNKVAFTATKCVVPKTMGSRRKISDESCLIVFFNDGGQHYRAHKLVEEMRAHTKCNLVQTKELTMQLNDAKRVFMSDSYTHALKQGPVIGFEYNGDDCIQLCQQAVVAVMQGSTGLVFVSQNKSLAQQQIENFYNYADMQMGF